MAMFKKISVLTLALVLAVASLVLTSCGDNGGGGCESGVHTFGTYMSNGDATCEKDGTKTAKCTKCDAVVTETDTDSKLPHSFTSYTANNDATCTKNGTESAKCANCDATDTREVANSALKHNFVDGKCTECEAADPDYNEPGEGGGEQENPCKDGHSFTKYTSNNDATCTKNGTESAKCDRCDATDTREVANSALKHNFVDGKCTECEAADPDYKPEDPEDPEEPEDPEKPDFPDLPDFPEIELPDIQFTSAGIVLKDFTVEVDGERVVLNVDKMYVTTKEDGTPFGYGNAVLVFSGEPLELNQSCKTEILLDGSELYIGSMGQSGFNSTDKYESYIKIDLPQAIDSLISQSLNIDAEAEALKIASAIQYIIEIYPEIEDIVINKIIPALGTFGEIEESLGEIDGAITEIADAAVEEDVSILSLLVSTFFKTNELEGGNIELTLTLDAIKALNENLNTATISELIDQIYGDDAYKTVKEAIPGILAYNVSDVVKMIEENGGNIDEIFAALDEIAAVIAGVEGATLEMLLGLPEGTDVCEMLKSEEMKDYSVVYAIMMIGEFESVEQFEARLEEVYKVLEGTTLYGLMESYYGSSSQVNVKDNITNIIETLDSMVYFELEIDTEGNVVYYDVDFDFISYRYSATMIDGVVEAELLVPINYSAYVAATLTFSESGACNIDGSIITNYYDENEQTIEKEVGEFTFIVNTDGTADGEIVINIDDYTVARVDLAVDEEGICSVDGAVNYIYTDENGENTEVELATITIQANPLGTFELEYEMNRGESNDKLVLSGDISNGVDIDLKIYEGDYVYNGTLDFFTSEDGVTKGTLTFAPALVENGEGVVAEFTYSDEDGFSALYRYIINENYYCKGEISAFVGETIDVSFTYDNCGDKVSGSLSVADDGAIAGSVDVGGVVTAQISGNVQTDISASFNYEDGEEVFVNTISISKEAITEYYKVVMDDVDIEFTAILGTDGKGTIEMKGTIEGDTVNVNGSYEVAFGGEYELDLEAAEALKAAFDKLPEFTPDNIGDIFGDNNYYGDVSGEDGEPSEDEEGTFEEVEDEEKEEGEYEQKPADRYYGDLEGVGDGEFVFSVVEGEKVELGGTLVGGIASINGKVSQEFVPIYDENGQIIGVDIIIIRYNPSYEYNYETDSYKISGGLYHVEATTLYFSDIFFWKINKGCGDNYLVDLSGKCYYVEAYYGYEGSEIFSSYEEIKENCSQNSSWEYYKTDEFDFVFNAKTNEIVEKYFHNFKINENKSKAPASCEQYGYRYYECEDCGESYKYYYEKYHNEQYLVTANENGSYTVTIDCLDCDKTATRTLWVKGDCVTGITVDSRGIVICTYFIAYTPYTIEVSCGCEVGLEVIGDGHSWFNSGTNPSIKGYECYGDGEGYIIISLEEISSGNIEVVIW